MALTVRGTKKGSFAISVAKRPMGKKVTILTNVSGAGVNELLSALKKKLGTGGTRTAHDTIEVAGDRAAAVEKVLREMYPDALVGVRRLAPPAEKAPPPTTTTTTTTTSREPRAKPRHGASTQTRRAMPKIVVLSKPKETSKTFQGYRRLLTSWIYWDRDVLNLHDMFDRHVREHDTSSLLEEWPTEVSDEMRASVPAHIQSKEERRAALMDIGMISTPSAFKMSRLERRREAAMSAAASKRESSSTTSAFSSSALPSMTSSKVAHFDPATELLREHGFAPARGKHEPTTSQVRAPKTAPNARVSRVSNTKARARPTRPTGGMYTSLRKGVGSFNADDSRFAQRALDSSDEDVDNRPATWRQGFETGFTRDASGKFTFGDEVVQPLPKVDVRNATPSHPSNGASARERRYDEHDDDDDDDDDADLMEAMRLSQIEYDTNQQRAQQHALHVECDELFADMTEEDILAYVISMSEAEAFEARVPIADDVSPENMPSRTEWIELRLGELFYPNMDTAREVAQILPAMVGADMTLDLLEGAGASRDDAQAFLNAYASLTLTDTNTHRDGASTTRVDESRVDEFTAWANAFLSQFSREDIADDAFVEFLAAVEDPTEIAAFILDTFPNADTAHVSAFAHEFAARARRR